jgi:Extensin-like protein C-terminus
VKLQKALTRYFTLLVLPSALVVGVFLRFAPPQHNPFVPLDLNHKPGLASHFKMTQLERHPDACFNALDATGVLYTPLEDSPRGEACGKYDALTLDRSLTPYSATLSMTCWQTASLYMWERHVARPAATEIFGSPIARIETYGSFSCRNIAGTGRKSEHAAANAVDISGFRLEDGRLQGGRIPGARPQGGLQDFLGDPRAGVQRRPCRPFPFRHGGCAHLPVAHS